MIEKREADYVVSATDAKNRFGSLLSRVAESGEAVVVERQGKAQAAVISIEEFRELRRLQQAKRRTEAVEALRRLRDEIAEANKDMTPEQVEEFAQQVRRDVAQGLMDKGLIRYEE